MKRRFLSILFALVLVLSVSLVTAAPVGATGSDWYVDATVGSSGTGTSLGTAFKTIGEGVTAASSGDTVNVAEGTYSAATNGETFPIIVTKDITIKALGAVANTILDVKYAIGVQLKAAATLEGFTITNLTSAAMGISIYEGSAGGKAIGNVINGGKVHIGNSCSSITVQGNIINGGNIDMYKGLSGILIKGNKISNYTSAGIDMKPLKTVGSTNSNVTVENNEVDSCSVGGIWHYQGFTSGLTIKGNKVFNISGTGICVSNGSDITIENNEVYDNTKGISIGKGSDGIGVGVGAQVVVNYNNIYGNTDYGLKNWDTLTIDATNNWWGSDTGPEHASNPLGTGDPVSDYVDFVPWLVQTPESGEVTMTGLVITKIGISVTPPSVDFGSLVPGTPSAGKPVTVTNTGNVKENFSAEITNESPAGVYTGTPGLTVGGVAVNAWLPTNVPALGIQTPSLVLTIPPGTAPGTYTATLIFWAEMSK